MAGRGARTFWLSRWLYGLSLSLAACLIFLVILAPFGDDGVVRPHGGGRWVTLFARDATLRKTTVATALGLAVTACVFFRPAPRARTMSRKQGKPRPPTSGVVGA
jgi:hypothetical protein